MSKDSIEPTTLINKIDRPLPVQSRIIGEIKRRISCGQFAPGMQLPSQTALQDEFGTTLVTVTRALNLLKKQGFIHSRWRQGTYVSAAPPCLCDFAIVHPWHDFNSQYIKAIENELESLAAQPPPGLVKCRFRFFSEIHCPTTDIGHHHQELFDAVASETVAGLIFPGPSYKLVRKVKEANPRIPCATSLFSPIDGCINIWYHSIIDRAFDILAGAGRKRVAYIINAGGRNALTNEITSAALQRGITIKPYWIQAVDVRAPEWASNAAELLMRLPPRDRPDAIVIHDDNFVPYATAGLARAGARVAEDVMVIAHTNFPWPTPSAVPVTRLGLDVRKMVRLMIHMLMQQRQGERIPNSLVLPVCTEDDALRDARDTDDDLPKLLCEHRATNSVKTRKETGREMHIAQ